MENFQELNFESKHSLDLRHIRAHLEDLIEEIRVAELTETLRFDDLSRMLDNVDTIKALITDKMYDFDFSEGEDL